MLKSLFFFKTFRLIIHTFLISAFANYAVADHTADLRSPLVEIEIRGANKIPASSTDAIVIGKNEEIPYRDIGELARELPGITGSRMGGHGVDPTIRGQSQSQLNITADDAFIHGACPNRMDPATSMLTAAQGSAILAERGYQSVTNGPGGSGGRIKVIRNKPVFEKGRNYYSYLNSGYISNGDAADLRAEASAGGEDSYVRTLGFWRDYGNYEDGSGESVRSAFESFGGSIDGSTKIDQDINIGFAIDKTRTLDALFAGAGMDSPEADSTILRLNVDNIISKELPQEIKFSMYSSIVDHTMDNYSLRERNMNFMRTDSDSDTMGGKFQYIVRPGRHNIVAGTDYNYNAKDAKRYSSPDDRNNVNMINSRLWPDIDTGQFGLFAEDRIDLSERTNATFGLRFDKIIAQADSASSKSENKNMMPGMQHPMVPASANNLYNKYYGTDFDDADENNWGSLFKVEHDITAKHTIFAGAARVVRTADATERGIASAMGTDSWIGNPLILPEKHSQFEIGGALNSETWGLRAAAYYDLVDDYILRDTARGQDGILMSDGATIYRNIDAQIAGTELSSTLKFSEQWELESQAFYTWAEDTARNKALPQIPPLQGDFRLYYKQTGYKAWLTARAAAKQTRADTDPLSGTGRDVRKTPGYTVFDLSASLSEFEQFEIRFGILNILDKLYANHLNRSNSFDPVEIQVNEPGRTFFIQLNAKI